MSGAPSPQPEATDEDLGTQVENLDEATYELDSENPRSLQEVITYAENLGEIVQRANILKSAIDAEIKNLGEGASELQDLEGLKEEIDYLVNPDRLAMQIKNKWESVARQKADETQTPRAEMLYQSGMDLLTNTNIPAVLLSQVATEVIAQGVRTVDDFGTEHDWLNMNNQGRSYDHLANKDADLTRIQQNPDMAVRFVEANLVRLERSIQTTRDNLNEKAAWFINIVDEYQVLAAIPETNRNAYKARIDQWRV